MVGPGASLESRATTRRYEFGWHWSPTANQHDAIAGVEIALTEAETMLDGVSMVDHLTDPDTGEIVPITLVTDNGRTLPVVPVRALHHRPSGTQACPDSRSEQGP